MRLTLIFESRQRAYFLAFLFLVECCIILYCSFVLKFCITWTNNNARWTSSWVSFFLHYLSKCCLLLLLLLLFYCENLNVHIISERTNIISGYYGVTCYYCNEEIFRARKMEFHIAENMIPFLKFVDNEFIMSSKKLWSCGIRAKGSKKTKTRFWLSAHFLVSFSFLAEPNSQVIHKMKLICQTTDI